MHRLLHGHFLAAFFLNPLLVLLLPFFFWSALSYLVRVTRGRTLPHPFRSPCWAWFLVAAVLGFGILRNLPFAPFNYFAG